MGSAYASDCYHCVVTICKIVRKLFNGLSVVEWLKYCNEYFFLLKSKISQSILNFMFTTNQIGFEVTVTEVEAILKQRWDEEIPLKNNLEATLCNVEKPLYQHCATWDNVDRLWNVDWVDIIDI